MGSKGSKGWGFSFADVGVFADHLGRRSLKRNAGLIV
jgi:hypothetical protein